MNKKIIIIGLTLLLFGICSFILWDNRVVSTITLEINPSIEIRLNKSDKVINVVPLNEDAKEVIKGNFLGKNLDTVLEVITDNVIANGYVAEDEIPILLYSTGHIDSGVVTDNLTKKFEDKQIHATITIIEEVTKEDRELANKYNLSVVKAAYINEILQNNANLNVENLTNKQIRELRETKRTGKYCDKDYTLEGDFCLKETGRIAASRGDICPNGYYEYENKCYEETNSIDSEKYGCPEGFTLTNDNKCTGVEKIDATPNFKCETGELIQRGHIRIPSFRDVGDWNEYLCEDKSSATYPTERCYQQEHAIINGKCAMGPKPLLPTPTGCEGNDINYNGGCYDPNPSEPYICPNGDRYDTNTELCPDTFTYTKAIGNYTCKEGYTVSGSMCTKKRIEDATHKKICPSGYTLVNQDRCINKTKTTDHIEGNLCDEKDSRLSGNECILYEIIDAKQSN